MSAGNFVIETNIIDENYEGTTDNTIIIKKVYPNLTVNQIGNTYENTNLSIKLGDDEKSYANQKLTMIFSNGESYTLSTDANGEALLALNFNVGEYDYQAVCYNSNINAEQSGTVIIEKAKANLEGSPITKYFQNSTQLTVIVKDGKGNVLTNKEVALTINNQTYYKTSDDNGRISLKIDQNPGTYTASVALIDDNYEADENISVKVLAIPVKLTANNLNMYYNNNSQLVVSLTDKNGKAIANKKVSITINGKTYTKTTDSKGKVSLKITDKAGTYKSTVKFNAVGYESASKTVTVKVLKPKFAVASKTVKKGKSLTITFKDANGKVIKSKKVTVKIKGKTYTKTTNSKGQVSIKITLKPGKYKVVSGFAKNSIYGTTTSSFTLTVKK